MRDTGCTRRYTTEVHDTLVLDEKGRISTSHKDKIVSGERTSGERIETPKLGKNQIVKYVKQRLPVYSRQLERSLEE